MPKVSKATVRVINEALGTSYGLDDLGAYEDLPAIESPQLPMTAFSLLDCLPEEARHTPLVTMPWEEGDTVAVVRVVYLKDSLVSVAVLVF